MKRNRLIATMVIMMGLALCVQTGCSSTPSKGGDTPSQQVNENVQIANPWRDITEAEAMKLFPGSFRVPSGAENVMWSVMETWSETLVQLSFDLNGESFTAREQVTKDKNADISGMYYDWTQKDEITLKNWADGKMKGTYYRFVGDDEWADLCTWYDAEKGISYSVSVTSKDLDGFDLQAIAEALGASEK